MTGAMRESGSDYAILIGLARYPTLAEGMKPADLEGPENDLEAVKRWLLDPEGGGLNPAHVFEKRADGGEPTADTLELDLLAKLSQAAARNPSGRSVGRRLYLYLSGHGFSPMRLRACLFTPNATFEHGFNMHATGWLSWLQDSGYFREYVLWMDSCMNRVSFVPPVDPRLRPLAAAEPPRASFVAFAAQRPLRALEMPIPEDAGRVHGVFTWALIEGLRGAAADRHGKVTGHSLANWVRNAMAARIPPQQLADPDVAKDPEIVQEDPSLVFARGLAKPCVPVALAFPTLSAPADARLWGDHPPRVVASFRATPGGCTLKLPPGLYVCDVPSAGLRHGFEVLHARHVEVRDFGAPANPALGAVFSLSVDPVDPTAEIYVIDAAFALADSATARLTTRLPCGIYKVKTRVGRARKETLLLLDSNDVRLVAEQAAEASPTVAPLSGDALQREAQIAARRDAQLESTTLEPDAPGAALLVMVRSVRASGSDPISTAPWEGVHVVDAKGKRVLDFAAGAPHGPQHEPHATVARALAPGLHFLRQRLEDGTAIEQSLILCAGWRLEAYVLRRASEEGMLQGRPRVSVLMRRHGEIAGSSFDDRLVETARIALADERAILNDELESLLFHKLENPIAGVLGAHLLLVERERDPRRDLSALGAVVANLQRVLGVDHPDVAALALQCLDVAAVAPPQRLLAPPMFQRSWKLLVDAAQKRRNLIPLGLWRRVQANSALPPFLIWSTDTDVKEAARSTLARALQLESGDSPEPAAALDDGSAEETMASPLPRTSAQASASAAKRLQRESEQRAAQLSIPPSALRLLRSEKPEPSGPR